MSSFFTIPASQKKRKRDDASAPGGIKRRATIKPTKSRPSKAKASKPARDESISGSGSEDESPRKRAGSRELLSDSVSDSEDETAAEKRLRLAEQYLQNIKGTVDEAGFDAEDIDRDLIAERLQEDTAETKGRLYRHITSTLDFSSASKTQFRADTLTTTGIATCPPYAYTVSKDMHLVKWQLPEPPPTSSSKNKQEPPPKNQKLTRRRPTKLLSSHGTRHKSADQSYMNHTSPILCVAASPTGQFVATGGADRKLIIWNAADLKPLKVFNQHRDAVTSLAFRRGTNQLYSSSKDRTIKTWSLNELAYVETLFGHQDEVVDVAAGGMERCISVGSRDRTARLWKVSEETQLVFRGGGGGGGGDKKRKPRRSNEEDADDEGGQLSYVEGSIDRVALVDEESFVTGSDNGSISLWSLHKKKPVFTIPLAHGLEPKMDPAQASAETDPLKRIVPDRNPRWVTALSTVPFSDLVVSGSWDGEVRVWRVVEGKRRLDFVGRIGPKREHDAGEAVGAVPGVLNDLSCFERGKRGKETLCVVVAVGTEHRFGGWVKVKGARSGAVVLEVPRLTESRTRVGKSEVADETKTEGEVSAVH